MRAGGGHAKGAAWEREVGVILSLWITRGEHRDIFSRNVLSGGAFTVAQKAGKSTSRSAGDLMAASPLAFRFLERFMVECKHLNHIGLENYLWNSAATSPLGLIISYAHGQAEQAGGHYMLIAKQNRKPPLVFLRADVGQAALESPKAGGARKRVAPNFHLLHRRRVYLSALDAFCDYVDPERFLAKW